VPGVSKAPVNARSANCGPRQSGSLRPSRVGFGTHPPNPRRPATPALGFSPQANHHPPANRSAPNAPKSGIIPRLHRSFAKLRILSNLLPGVVHLNFRVILLFIAIVVSITAEPAALPPDAIVDNYLTASRDQERTLNGASMDVEFAASLPNLKKQGHLHALRRISVLGLIKYERLRFEGDSTVNKQIITRYLSAEAQAQMDPQAATAVTPQNYKFKYKGLSMLDGRPVHVFQVSPKQKRQSLFNGEIQIDADTYLRVQESGYLVKSPSFFLKRVAFVRKYEIRNGISVPLQVQSVVDTRLVGKAELTIDFTNFSIDPKQGVVSDDDGQ